MSRNVDSNAEDRVIRALLEDIEDERGLTVLRAKDYGSRARGLAPNKSDYDVHFIYLQPYYKYIVGPRYRDTIERASLPEDNDLDRKVELHGWNLRKLIGGSQLEGHYDGLIGSNPMSMEYVASNREYYTYPGTEEHWDRIESHLAGSFKPYALIKHYGSLAMGNYNKYIVEDDTTVDITIKRYGNICQAILKREHVARTKELPTMNALDLLRASANEVPSDVYAAIGDVFNMKRTGRGDVEPSERIRTTLDPWIEETLDHEHGPEGNVERQPDLDLVEDAVVEIVDVIDG